MSLVGSSKKKEVSEATLKARVWRAKRQAKADSLGIAVKDLKRETSRANFWSEGHRKMLYHMAVVCYGIFREEGIINNLCLDELVNAAWLDCARRDKHVEGCGTYYLAAMVKYVRAKQVSLNGMSRIRVCYLEEVEGLASSRRSRFNHTKGIDSADMVEYLLSLIPKESTRHMIRRLFIDGIHKAQIARDMGLGKCSVGSRIERALAKIRNNNQDLQTYL